MFRMLLLLLVLLHAAPRAEAEKIRVACIGDSITFGAGIAQREQFSYPAQLQGMLGESHMVRNFGVSGATMLKKGDLPYWRQKAYAEALAFKPDVVVIKLGSNDSKPQNWRYKNEFASDARALIVSFRGLPNHPRVLLCLPVPAFREMWGINDEVIFKEQIPALQKLAFETGTELVDLHTALLGKGEWFPDNIHPNAQGARAIAENVRAVLTIKPDAGFDIERALAAQGIQATVSSYFGYRSLEFTWAERRCRIVRPHVTAAGRPYTWVAEFFGVLPQVDRALLQHGFHLVNCNVLGLMGGEPAMTSWDKFHQLLQKAGLEGKFTLIGISRGGLYSYNWAMRHPETVACIYGDAPVCDFRSWPGGKGKAPGNPKEWESVIKYYGFKNEAEALAYKKNPVDNLQALDEAGIALIHVVGQADKVVPVEENTDLIEKRYKALGGTIKVIRKPGVDHHPHGLDNPAPVVDFILAHATAD